MNGYPGLSRWHRPLPVLASPFTNRLLAASILATAHAVAVDIPLGPAGQDTYIDGRSSGPAGDQTGVNHGTGPILQIVHSDQSHANHVVGLLQFDLAGAPTTDVTQVWLTMTIDPSSTATTDATMVSAHHISGPWTGGTVTWNTRPAWNGTAADAVHVRNTPRASYRWDVTPLYHAWVNGTFPNHGISLVSWDANGEGYEFVSSENTTDPNLRPRLTIETGPSGPVPTGSYVLHELSDGFQGADYGGRPGISMQALLETINVTLGPGTLTGNFTASDAIRTVHEQFTDLSRGVPNPQAGWPNPDQDHVWQNQLHMQLMSESGSFSGSYRMTDTGEIRIFSDGETVSYQASPSGNTLVHSGVERDASGYLIGVAMGVKKPTTMTPAEIAGDWVIAEVGRSFEGPQHAPPGPPEHAWGVTEGIMGALFDVSLDAAGTVTGNGPEVILRRTLSERFEVNLGPSPMTTPPWDYQDTQSWSEFSFSISNDGEPWAGTYTVDPDGTLVMTIDDDGEDEIITYNVAADGDVMILGEVLTDSAFVEGIVGIGLRKPTAMTPADVVGKWVLAGWETSLHGGPPEFHRLNRQVLGSKTWITMRPDGTYIGREEAYDLDQALSNDLIGLSGESINGSLDADNIVRNRVDLHIAGPSEEFFSGGWTVSPTGVLTLTFMEDGESESIDIHVSANAEVCFLSETWDEDGSSGAALLVGVKQPTTGPADLGPPQVIGSGTAPSVQIPLRSASPKHASRVMRLRPDGTWEDRGFATNGGTLVIPPEELEQHPVQLFRLEE